MKKDPFLPPQPNKTRKYCYNPTKDDFTTTYADENNVPIEYTVHSEELVPFPAYIAEHVAKHLAHKIVMERGIKQNYQDDFDKVLKEVLIDQL